MRRLLCCLGTLSLRIPAEAAAQTDRFAEVRGRIRQIMDSLGIPGIGVAVAKDGTPLLFSLASISKPMTATGLHGRSKVNRVEGGAEPESVPHGFFTDIVVAFQRGEQRSDVSGPEVGDEVNVHG